MEHGSLKSGLLIIPKREAHGNTIYDATSTLSVTLYFDATRAVTPNPNLMVAVTYLDKRQVEILRIEYFNR